MLLLPCLFVFTACPFSSAIQRVKSMWEQCASRLFFSPSQLYLCAAFTCSSFHPCMHAISWWELGQTGAQSRWTGGAGKRKNVHNMDFLSDFIQTLWGRILRFSFEVFMHSTLTWMSKLKLGYVLKTTKTQSQVFL